MRDAATSASDASSPISPMRRVAPRMASTKALEEQLKHLTVGEYQGETVPDTPTIMLASTEPGETGPLGFWDRMRRLWGS